MLIESLKVIKTEWELDAEKLSALTHVSETVLDHFLKLDQASEGELPSIPQGLESSVALVSIYQKLKKKFPNTEDQLKWLFAEHQDFGGNKPIDIISQSKDDLLWVSYYLESGK